MDVTDVSAGLLAHFIDIFLYPRQVVEWGFVSRRYDCHIARTGIGWFGVDPQDHLLVGGADQCVVKVAQRGNRRAVDRQNIIAWFYIYADGSKRRTRLFVPIFPR